ncbi:MAG TPA: Do family serine endopeptidase [Bacteroidota bacterium]|nr:Do family serine endopeptidase [Bacteroidota bacterium]
MKKMSMKSVVAAVFLISLGIVFGVVLVSSFKGVDFSFAGDDVKLGAKQAPVKPNATLQLLNDAFHSVGETVTPSVVYVEVETSGSESEEGAPDDQSEFFHRFFGPDFKFEMPKQAPQIGAGSGVIVTENGYILTNNHVVANAKKNGIKVQLSDTREFKAKLVGTDKYTDLAVIKIDADNLPVAALGNSEEVQVGHIVFAIGAPLGLKSTMTQGIVSALGRNIGINGDQYAIENFIQTDAAVNPGNSGGPLVDISGQVIGINTAIATTNARYQGYSFAIPINLAKKVATDLIKFGKFRRGFLGVSIQQVDAVTAKAAGLDKAKGVWIQSVTKDAAGDKAGLQDGDIILSVDGKETNSPQTLQTTIASKYPGEVAVLKVWREKKEKEIKVTLGSRDGDTESIAETKNEKDESDVEKEQAKPITVKELGLTVSSLDTGAKKKYDVQKGVLVSDLEDFGIAQERGLQKGDVIINAGGQAISSPKQFQSAVKKLNPGDAIMLRVKGQDKRTRFVAIEIPK